ncbi:hypothetical protein AGMMS49975_12460 [Clostridia bacterium]|nr:hypothetical protein AGMMS49975_12460 [Clostridia bacterium]
MNKFVIFMIGAVVGSVAAWKFLKGKYERIAQEEIDSVKDIFSKRETVSAVVEVESPAVDDKKEEVKPVDAPYVISPDEFGEFDDYELITLYFYDDAIVADDNGDVLEDVENTIGFESLGQFNDYVDEIHVRNNRLKCDYEVLKDEKKYSDIGRGK